MTAKPSKAQRCGMQGHPGARQEGAACQKYDQVVSSVGETCLRSCATYAGISKIIA